MLQAAITFLIIALIAGLLGLFQVQWLASEIAWILFVAFLAIRGGGPKRFERIAVLVLGDLVLQVLLVLLGLALLFEPDVLLHPAEVAGSPSAEDLVFAFPLVLVAFSGIDASSGLAGQVKIGRASGRR